MRKLTHLELQGFINSVKPKRPDFFSIFKSTPATKRQLSKKEKSLLNQLETLANNTPKMKYDLNDQNLYELGKLFLKMDKNYLLPELADRILPYVKILRRWIVGSKELMGKGGQGHVYLFVLRGKVYAAKIFFELQRRYLKNERDILTKLDHPNIIKGYFNFNLEERILLLEAMPQGDLYDFIHTNEQNQKYKGRLQKLSIIQQIASALAYLHSRNVLHLDLKPHNILINKKNEGNQFTITIKVCDFSLSVQSTEEQTLEHSPGTISYTAPEVLFDKLVSVYADSYSFGILIYEIITESIPYLELADDPKMRLSDNTLNIPLMASEILNGRRPSLTEPYDNDPAISQAKNHWLGKYTDRPLSRNTLLFFNRLISKEKTKQALISNERKQKPTQTKSFEGEKRLSITPQSMLPKSEGRTMDKELFITPNPFN